MATDKVKLSGVRVRQDVMADLKRLHETNARRRTSTGNRITFSSWIEEILVDYIRITDLVKEERRNPSSHWEDFS